MKLAQIILFFVLLVIFVVPAWADEAPRTTPDKLIVNPFARDRVSLNGAWQYIVDPMDIGAGNWKTYGFFEDNRPTSPLQLREFSFSPANSLNVPGDWNSQKRDLFLYQGVVWYRRVFDCPTHSGRQFLYFGAVNYHADVFLNGSYLASHDGGYTPFVIEVTGKIKTSANLLVVRVDSALSSETVPALPIDWLNAGGITRDVDVIFTGRRFIRDYFLRLMSLKRKTITVSVTVDGGTAGDRVLVGLPEIRRTATIRLKADGRGEAAFSAPVALWSPSHPKLYKVIFASDGDRVVARVGFRTIARRGAQILLNGKPIFLKGISAQDESPLHRGVARGATDATAIMHVVKNLGANFVRLAHYPCDEQLLQAADRMGILVWSEIPVWQSIDFASSSVFENARAQLSDQIIRDRNHPSVIIWSVGNETPLSKRRDVFLQKLVDRARELDPTRLVTAALSIEPNPYLERVLPVLLARIALNSRVAAPTRSKAQMLLAKLEGSTLDPSALRGLLRPVPFPIDDDLAKSFDVIAVNEYFGWYYPQLVARWAGIDEPTLRFAENLAMESLHLDPTINRPFIVSEFGADAIPGFRGDAQTLYSETYQAAVYQRQLAMLKNSRKLAGVSPWVLMDFPSLMRTKDFRNHKGIMDETGKRKAAYYVLRAFFESALPR